MNKKKKQIIDAALQLFVDKGFALTSIQDIIDEANVAKGTFYNYFASKNDCLMAILDFVHQEADRRRQAEAIGKSVTDESVLVKQIAIRMNINREHRLISLFETVGFSDDKELIAFIKQQHIDEIEWLAKRLEEVFSQETADYALDQAVILLGMIHHFMHVWTLGSEKEITTENIIRFALKRLKPMISDQTERKDVFLPRGWLSGSTNESKAKRELVELIVKAIQRLQTELLKEKEINVSEELEYTNFLLKEVQSDQPRTFLFERITESLSQLLQTKPFNQQTTQLSQQISILTQKLK
ncbi:transcriptional regulator, TetR family [Oceanobacillus limi]|uniref:Transcriptional regulator, TetR family n=1 Tax=Oceanobacillus limi TaxID=930131 RepID=A0A1H9YA69_9BACI|nr:TetR/AcrR family transcriptional regulator [Oceanobacillus limi]SES65856.1 transcriptional regulator, TetR family [Oceanobacillus limi]